MKNQAMFGTFCMGLCVCGLLLAGCSDVEEERQREAFRQSLIEKAVYDDTRRLGEAFLKNNAQRSNVIVMASGLQYRVLKSGKGDVSPTFDQFVVVDYQGRRVDDYVFDDTIKKGSPSVFPVNKVIRGWQQALIKMHIGDQWELFVPANLAYGATSPSTDIPANSALIFTVELLDIQSQDDREQKDK